MEDLGTKVCMLTIEATKKYMQGVHCHMFMYEHRGETKLYINSIVQQHADTIESTLNQL